MYNSSCCRLLKLSYTYIYPKEVTNPWSWLIRLQRNRWVPHRMKPCFSSLLIARKKWMVGCQPFFSLFLSPSVALGATNTSSQKELLQWLSIITPFQPPLTLLAGPLVDPEMTPNVEAPILYHVQRQCCLPFSEDRQVLPGSHLPFRDCLLTCTSFVSASSRLGATGTLGAPSNGDR